MVINHFEDLLPSRFCHLYIEHREELLASYGTPFKTLTTFINDQTVIIEINMPEDKNDSVPTSEDSPNPEELKETEGCLCLPLKILLSLKNRKRQKR